MSRPKRVPGCDVEGCEREHDAHGYCSLHKRRWLKHGDVRMNLKLRDRGSEGPITHVDTHELAWAAGFFDGEGYVGTGSNGHNTGVRRIRMNVSQKGRELLDRFNQAVGVGMVHDKGYGGMYGWDLAARNHVHRVMWLLWPWLGSVKRRQFERACADYHAWPLTAGGESHH